MARRSGYLGGRGRVFAGLSLLIVAFAIWTPPSRADETGGLWRAKMFIAGIGEPRLFNFRIAEDGRIFGQFEQPVGMYPLTVTGNVNGAGVVMNSHVPDKTADELRMMLPTGRDREMARFDLDKILFISFSGRIEGATMTGTGWYRLFRGPTERCAIWLSGNDYVRMRFFSKDHAIDGKPLEKPDCSYTTETLSWSATVSGQTTGQPAPVQQPAPAQERPDGDADGDATARKLAGLLQELDRIERLPPPAMSGLPPGPDGREQTADDGSAGVSADADSTDQPLPPPVVPPTGSGAGDRVQDQARDRVQEQPQEQAQEQPPVNPPPSVPPSAPPRLPATTDTPPSPKREKALAELCSRYARRAIAKQRRNRRLGCGYGGDRWNLTYDAHYAWCLRADAAERRKETAARRDEMNRCIARGGDAAATGRKRAAPSSDKLGPARPGWTLSGGEILRFYQSSRALSCRRDCARDPLCVGYTWVRPGGYQQGAAPVCYLMASVKTIVRNACCEAAAKGGQLAKKPRPAGPDSAAGRGPGNGVRLSVPARGRNRTNPVMTPVLERGRTYTFVVEGEFGYWPGHGYGVDAVWVYNSPNLKGQKVWNSLRIGDYGISDYLNFSPPLDSGHRYSFTVVGTGQSLPIFIANCHDGCSGGFDIEIR